jgi:hypothetical protein
MALHTAALIEENDSKADLALHTERLILSGVLCVFIKFENQDLLPTSFIYRLYWKRLLHRGPGWGLFAFALEKYRAWSSQ